MALTTKPNRFYPAVPAPGLDLASIHNTVEQMRTAMLTYQRSDANYNKSFVRFEELVDLGIIDADGNSTLSTASGGGASELIDLTDVSSVAYTNRYVLVANGTDFAARALVEADISDLGAYISNVVEDTTPQLGGNLDVQANEINTSTVNGNVSIQPNGTGNVVLGNYTFDGDQTVGATEDNYVLTYDFAGNTIQLEPGGSGPTTDHPHTGEVTGTTALTVDVTSITNRTAVTEVSDSGIDDIALHDATDGSFKKTPVNLVTDGGYF